MAHMNILQYTNSKSVEPELLILESRIMANVDMSRLDVQSHSMQSLS